ncbi:AAA family ATPase [Burkholderia anthina]|uniref:AAA family ATPase n=1 Tax=Burkholderia anthina TaxID=179879 RepID=UPI00158E6557|nr:AAA family ATPase [Burkholderia anthina]
MENYIASAVITGLWGRENERLNFKFNEKFNFIIGRNGTGKTTVINLLAAALTADFERLDKIQFSEVLIVLRPKSGRHRPSIQVLKTLKPNLPYFDITYKIKDSANSEAKTFDLDAFEEERVYRGLPSRAMRERYYRERFIFVQRHLESFVRVNWLSVHRQINEVADLRPEERRTMPPIDQKLAAMNNQLVRYFSRIATSYAEETLNFQRASFLSLISLSNDTDLRSFVGSMNIDEEKKSLASILDLLGISSRQYSRLLDQVANKFEGAREPFIKSESITIQQLLAIFNSYKAHSLVQAYEDLQKRKSKIFATIDIFLSVLNGLLAPRKTASLSEQNELVIKNKDGAPIQIEDLSSGEKQLLIILGQALLQESAPVIYIADEPELSLHVDWQEKITSSISEINPNAQIIFATHSPDIVGPNSDSIIDMEQV